MAIINFKSAGVSARTINLSGPTAIKPTGIPAGIIGTSQKGPAFVPTTVATMQDFVTIFGSPSDNTAEGPLAVSEWLRNAQAATFIKTLGVGNGLKRETSGDNKGRVAGAGFIVGDQQPQDYLGGNLGASQNTVLGGAPGRTYILGCFMSESAGSTVFTDAGLSGSGAPIVRGILMTPSGVLLTLSSSMVTVNTASAIAANWSTVGGAVTGSVNLNAGRQEFVMLINGFTPQDALYPRIITASFDMNAANYFGNMFNRDPYQLEKAGHYLYAEYEIHPALAVVTGANAVLSGNIASGFENVAFLLTGSATRNSGTLTAPNFENFEDRYRTAKSPWVTSQKFGGKRNNLFRIHALDDGAFGNGKVKISIESITPSNTDSYLYGTFDVLVRDYSDGDKDRKVLESYRGVSLDPDSSRYIARVIGDYHTFYNLDTTIGNAVLITEGNYPNNSQYIRVEVAEPVENKAIDATSLPMGFRGPPHLMTAGTGPFTAFAAGSSSGSFSAGDKFTQLMQPPIPFRENLTRGVVPNKTIDKGLYWGVQFEQKTSVTEPNKSTAFNPSIDSFAAYFPDFHTDFMNVIVSNNEGTPSTVANGIIDADLFNNNAFSLENIRVYYNATTALPDITLITSWSYVRAGNITTDSVNLQRALATTDLTDPSTRQVAKFSFYLQGGFDGVRVFNKNTNLLRNEAAVEEINNSARGGGNGPTVKAYNTALDIIADSTEVDIQMMAMPGIRVPALTDRALQIAEERFDALYLMDIQNYDATNLLITSSNQTLSVQYTVTNFRDRGLNSSFGAAYFPDVVIRDTLTNTTRTVAPSVAVLGAIAHNDAVAYPWFAPAGFARGALETTNDASIKLSRTNMDDLYSVNINPLVSFAGSDGVVVWGQKTLLAQHSALDRVNVRRLMLNLRRQIKQISNRVVFEQGLPQTLARFSQLVNPILKRVQDQKGVDRFLVRIDTSTTTQNDFENKTIRGKVFLIPTRTLEFLSLDFVINNSNNFGQG